LSDTVTAAVGERSRVTIRQRAIEGDPTTVLLQASEGADLLVVGCRGHGGFVAALLGSVSQHCVQHAACLVVVIHGQHR